MKQVKLSRQGGSCLLVSMQDGKPIIRPCLDKDVSSFIEREKLQGIKWQKADSKAPVMYDGEESPDFTAYTSYALSQVRSNIRMSNNQCKYEKLILQYNSNGHHMIQFHTIRWGIGRIGSKKTYRNSMVTAIENRVANGLADPSEILSIMAKTNEGEVCRILGSETHYSLYWKIALRRLLIEGNYDQDGGQYIVDAFKEQLKQISEGRYVRTNRMAVKTANRADGWDY